MARSATDHRVSPACTSTAFTSDDTFPLAYNHTSVYEAKKRITYQLFIYKQPFASTAFYLPLAVIGAQFFFGIVLRRIGDAWEISWLTATSSVYRVWAPVTLTYLCLFFGMLGLEVGTWPGTVIGLCLLACVVTYTLYVLINTYQRWVRSASMGRFAFFFVFRVAMYASHVLLIRGGVQWVYALNLDEIDPPLAVDYGEAALFHGSVCRHHVPANPSGHTRVSLDFRVGVEGYFDPHWSMRGTKEDHGRRRVVVPPVLSE